MGGGLDRGLDNRGISPGKPYEVVVVPNAGSASWTLVVTDRKTTRPKASHVFGAPPADAKIRDRGFELFSYVTLGNLVTEETANLTAELFSTLDENFFVYASKPMKCMEADRVPAVGEPLMVELTSTREFNVRRANGHMSKCYGPIEQFVKTERPDEVTMPAPAKLQIHETENLWQPEEFLALAETDARIRNYAKSKATASACFDKQWAKLDPDGRANQYDLVSYDSSGKVKKLEDYGAKLQRKIDRACKLNKLIEERTTIRAKRKNAFVKRGAEILERVRQRFSN